MVALGFFVHRAVFNRVSKVIRVCFDFFFTTLRDWFLKLAPLSQPMRIKTKTYRGLLAAFSRAWRRLHVFASSSDWVTALFIYVVIGQCNNFWFNDTQMKTALLCESVLVCGSMS